MSERKVYTCDSCGGEIPERPNGAQGGATFRIVYFDARSGEKVGHLCDPCADQHPGTKSPRRGRPPKETT